MSSFRVTAQNKTTGRMESFWCIDDYFGKHRYGYVPNYKDGEALTEEQFEEQYEIIEQI